MKTHYSMKSPFGTQSMSSIQMLRRIRSWIALAIANFFPTFLIVPNYLTSL